MAHDVFISHSTSDKRVADAVCAGLENDGIRCWIAPRDVQPGRSFAGEIARAIKNSKAMVLIFSARSNHSEQVLREVQLAVTAHLHIVQFRIEDVILNDDLSYFLSTPHWLDALTPPLENHIDRLETAIRALLGTPIEPSAMVAVATKSQATTHQGCLWRSIVAILMGFFAYVIFDAATTLVWNRLGWYFLTLPFPYICAAAAGFITARYAPRNPMLHVWISGFVSIGLIIGAASIIAANSRYRLPGTDILFYRHMSGTFLGIPWSLIAGGATFLLCVALGGVLHRRWVKH
jgi:hypothetical protein